MSDINLQKRVQNLSVGKELAVYTGVIINVGQDSQGNDVSYTAGDDTGYVLEISNPNGTQEMAYTILAILKLRGVQYQPYDAGGALLDPAAEIGDGVTINGTASWIASAGKRFSRLMATDISAPYDEEINHEYKYTSRTQREFKRESAYTRARFTIDEDEISAKVSQIGGDNNSFGWTLTATSHTWYANNVEVMRVTKDGLKVTGEVVATSGNIGGCQIVNGVLTISGANISNINADTITAGILNVDRIAANSITGGYNGKIAKSTVIGWNVGSETLTGGSGGNIGQYEISTYNTTSGINANLGYAAGYGAATVNGTSTYPWYFTCHQINCDAMVFNSAGIQLKWSDVLGNYYLGSSGEG